MGSRMRSSSDEPSGHRVIFLNPGNLYVAEAFYGHNLPGWPRVRKIALDGMVTTVAGDGQRGYADGLASQTRFDFPIGPSIDSSGNIYLADDFNHRIRVVRPDGQVITLVPENRATEMDQPSWPSSIIHCGRLLGPTARSM